MLPERLLKDKFWLQLALLALVVAWSMPVVALALHAESHTAFSMAFALVWSGLMAGAGVLFYRAALKNDQLASGAIVLTVATLAFLYRAPSGFVHPEFTAEDGCVFFVQQREAGWGALLMTDAGYYHTFIRMVAALVAPFPTLFAPALYNLAWLASYSLVAVYILVQYPHRKLAPVIVLVTAFVSHSGEIFMTVTNSLWTVGLGMTAFVLLPAPDVKRWGRCLLAGTLLVFSLSGPFGIVLAPFYFLRWAADRRHFSFVYFLAVALGAAVQLSVLHSLHPDDHPGPPVTPSTFWLCLKIAVLRVPWSLAAGDRPPGHFWLIALLLVIILLGIVGREIKVDWRRQVFPVGCFVLCAIYVALDIFRVSPVEALAKIDDGDRYFYIPKVLFVWALVHLAWTARHRAPFFIALFFCAMGSMVRFTSLCVIVDNHWPHYAELIDQGQPVVVPTNPPGWTAVIKGRNESPPPK